MGYVILNDRGNEQMVPLRSSTLFGRHWRCDGHVGHRRVPMYWIEIRWMGESWVWRELTKNEGTRGTGALHHDDWRLLAGGERKGRIGFGERVWIRMEDPSPPEIFLEALMDGRDLAGVEVEEWLEFRDDGVYPLVDDKEEASRIVDGGLVSLETGLYRLHHPEVVVNTQSVQVDVSDPSCFLQIAPDRSTAEFTSRGCSVVVTGAAVLVLYAFVLAKQTSHPQVDGWMNTEEAFKKWLECGGNPESQPKRIGWEKGKLRTQLNKQGAIGLSALFEKRWVAGQPQTRIALNVDNIEVL